MNAAAACRVIGGVLVVLIGVALAWGGVQLERGGAAAWPDVVASEGTAKNVAIGMVILAVPTLVAGGAAIARLSWGGWAAAIATAVVVGAAFWANAALFGHIRPIHTGTNLVLAAMIWGLLWFGFSPR